MNPEPSSTPGPWPTDVLFRDTGLGRRRRRRSPIRLAPLIDVVFILLVFFMLASSFIDWRVIPMDAPAQGNREVSLVGALLVDVRRNQLRLGGELVSMEKLSARVETAVAATPDRHVLVRPGAQVPVQRSVEILDLLDAAGARNVSLISDLGVQQ